MGESAPAERRLDPQGRVVAAANSHYLRDMKWGNTARSPLALGLALVASCGGNTASNEICGPGTHDARGACLPDVTCGEGTVEIHGECVPFVPVTYPDA